MLRYRWARRRCWARSGRSARRCLGSALWFLGPVSDLLRSLGAWGWLAYVLMFVVSAGVGFLPTYGQSLLGGWVFGFAFGFPAPMLGFVGGNVIGCFIAKRLSKAQSRRHDRRQ